MRFLILIVALLSCTKSFAGVASDSLNEPSTARPERASPFHTGELRAVGTGLGVLVASMLALGVGAGPCSGLLFSFPNNCPYGISAVAFGTAPLVVSLLGTAGHRFFGGRGHFIHALMGSLIGSSFTSAVLLVRRLSSPPAPAEAAVTMLAVLAPSFSTILALELSANAPAFEFPLLRNSLGMLAMVGVEVAGGLLFAAIGAAASGSSAAGISVGVLGLAAGIFLPPLATYGVHTFNGGKGTYWAALLGHLVGSVIAFGLGSAGVFAAMARTATRGSQLVAHEISAIAIPIGAGVLTHLFAPLIAIELSHGNAMRQRASASVAVAAGGRSAIQAPFISGAPLNGGAMISGGFEF